MQLRSKLLFNSLYKRSNNCKNQKKEREREREDKGGSKKGEERGGEYYERYESIELQ